MCFTGRERGTDFVSRIAHAHPHPEKFETVSLPGRFGIKGMKTKLLVTLLILAVSAALFIFVQVRG
jgi:hypothetical protein